ncbi:MAG: hydrogenase maturation protease [Caldilineaceae bacterium]|nr:hydrogenase maturation protease [Caldilineaceae bacterium]
MRDEERGILIIGIGNPHRQDDGVGIAVARALAACALPATVVVEQAMAGPALLELWQGFATVIAIDALAGGVSPGRWHVMDAHTEPFPHRAAVDSSHGFGLAETIELARVLTLLPPALTLYGVEGAAFGFGEGLSPAVAKQVPALVVQICNNVRALAGGSS